MFVGTENTGVWMCTSFQELPAACMCVCLAFICIIRMYVSRREFFFNAKEIVGKNLCIGKVIHQLLSGCDHSDVSFYPISNRDHKGVGVAHAITSPKKNSLNFPK